jgi:hypothetical protein
MLFLFCETGTRRFARLEPAFTQLLAGFLPVFSLTMQSRTQIATELLAETLNLKKLTTFGVSANCNTTGLKVYPPQHVVENGPNTTSQISVWRFDWSNSPQIDLRAKSVNEFANYMVSGTDRIGPSKQVSYWVA